MSSIIAGMLLQGEVLPTSFAPYLTLLALGFAIGWYGHGAKSNKLIATGIVLILAAIILLQVATQTNQGQGPTGF
jgi:hypothetical protein